MSRFRTRFVLVLGLLVGGGARAEDATVAVAANFSAPLQALAEAYAKASGHTLTVVAGSTGKLYAQITQGAPYDLFLSADRERPLKLREAGLASGLCTYALGRLVLWSADAQRIAGDDPKATLSAPSLRHLAIANPATAPYGAAAQQVLTRLGLWPYTAAQLVQGEDIGQAWQMVGAGAAELGFVAASALAMKDVGGSRWDVPAEWHAPLAQEAALLKRGEGNAAARAFLAWLGSAAARERITGYGYALPAEGGCGN